MRICCVADLHGNLPKIPDCDVLLIAGDVVPTTAHRMPHSRSWLNKRLRPWLGRLDARGIIVVAVAGNHDFVFQEGNHEFISPLQWTYVEDESYVVRAGGEAISIYGSPWQPAFNNWAFNLGEDELEVKWDAIPLDLDVLLLHGPPFGYGDLAPAYGRRTAPEHVGSPSLTTAIQTKKPRLVVAGHIHDAYGVYTLGDSLVLNCSFVGEDYRPRNRPILLEMGERSLKVLESGRL